MVSWDCVNRDYSTFNCSRRLMLEATWALRTMLRIHWPTHTSTYVLVFCSHLSILCNTLQYSVMISLAIFGPLLSLQHILPSCSHALHSVIHSLLFVSNTLLTVISSLISRGRVFLSLFHICWLLNIFYTNPRYCMHSFYLMSTGTFVYPWCISNGTHQQSKV